MAGPSSTEALLAHLERGWLAAFAVSDATSEEAIFALWEVERARQRNITAAAATNVTNVKLRYENLHGRRGSHFALDFPSFAYP